MKLKMIVPPWLVVLIALLTPNLFAQSLAPSLPATEYIRANGRVLVTLKNSERVFTDIALTDSFYGPAHLMLDRGITTGCTGTSFCPNDPVNRGTTAVFIIRTLYTSLGGNGYPYHATTNPTGFTYPATPYFTDVPASHPFFPYIQKIRELGITGGCTPATSYCPDESITNGQIAVFTIRAWELRTTSTTAGQPGPYPPPGNFTYPTTACFPNDMPSGHPWFPFVQKACELKVVTTGCGGGYFCPSTPILRGAASFYYVRGILGDFMF